MDILGSHDDGWDGKRVDDARLIYQMDEAHDEVGEKKSGVNT